jgi:hypothetical protein
MKIFPGAAVLLLAGCAALPGSETLGVRCHTVTPMEAWGAISGLGGDHRLLYAVHDHNRPLPSILVLEPAAEEMTIRRTIPLLGERKKFDLEGVARRESGGFWVVSEGKGPRHPNLLLAIGPGGEIERRIPLPRGMERYRTRAGLEGVASRGAGKDEIVLVAFQRTWKDDPPATAKLGLYRPHSGTWRFLHYPFGEKG